MQYIFNFNSWNLGNPSSIPHLIGRHLEIVGVTMLVSILIAVPVGLLISRYRRYYLPVITISGLLYTIPALAFVAVMISITHLTLTTVLIPLVLYNQLILIRNTVAGIDAVDPLYLEVGKAVGMTRWQVLRQVTLPLALPVIVAGIRVATVTTISIASLAGFIGQGGLGSLIFENITVGDYDAILAGAILLALLAIIADLALLGLQTALNRGRDPLAVV